MLIQKNVPLLPSRRTSPWRKVAIGTWKTEYDPSVYGVLELRAEKALAYIEKLRDQTGEKLTITHFIGKALGETFRRHPSINCILRWSRLHRRESVDIFFQVASDMQGEDLSGTTIRHVDQKSVLEIAREMRERISQIRTKGDPAFSAVKKTMSLIPGPLVHYILRITSFIQYTLNIWSPVLGSPRDAFGGAMVTNIGSLGLDMAFAPLVPYSRVPIVIVVGAVADKPIVENGQIVIGKVLKLCSTFDHRLIDGVHASQMCRTLHEIFENPESLDH